MLHADICIAGAGIIGLTLALELHARGMSVIVAESGNPMEQASTAAAGMLAADDPHNPAELSALSHFSISLYPGFLAQIHELSGIDVPFQTHRTLQAIAGNAAPVIPPELRVELQREGLTEISLAPSSGFAFLTERSIDPRQLAPALIAAVRATSIRAIYNSPILSSTSSGEAVMIQTAASSIAAAHFIDCTGAWANSLEPGGLFKAVPIKGQMLALRMPRDLPLRTVLRTEDIYIVPRTAGPRAGHAIVGATVEDIGFDKTVEPHAIESLHQRAAALIPGLAHAAIVDAWAGLRPASADRLPLIGAHPTRPHHWLATGHYRNGILLAPATARIVAELLSHEQPSLSIDAFRPYRLMPSAIASLF